MRSISGGVEPRSAKHQNSRHIIGQLFIWAKFTQSSNSAFHLRPVTSEDYTGPVPQDDSALGECIDLNLAFCASDGSRDHYMQSRTTDDVAVGFPPYGGSARRDVWTWIDSEWYIAVLSRVQGTSSKLIGQMHYAPGVTNRDYLYSRLQAIRQALPAADNVERDGHESPEWARSTPRF